MPWYKLFDEQDKEWDGVLRYNVDDLFSQWYPDWVVGGRQLDLDIEIEARKLGPYYTPQVGKILNGEVF